MEKLIISFIFLSIVTINAFNININSRFCKNDIKIKNLRMIATSIQSSQPKKNIFSFISNIFTRKERSREQLAEGIAKFYDESSGIWLDVWGEHMHHGFYEPTETKYDHQQAQIDMIEKAINWSYGSSLNKASPKSVVDVGCGVGGSSRHIMKRYTLLYFYIVLLY